MLSLLLSQLLPAAGFANVSITALAKSRSRSARALAGWAWTFNQWTCLAPAGLAIAAWRFVGPLILLGLISGHPAGNTALVHAANASLQLQTLPLQDPGPTNPARTGDRNSSVEVPSVPSLNAGANASTDDAAKVRFSRLDTFYLPDKNGNLVPVFKLPFEEFEEMLQKRGAAEPQLQSSLAAFRMEKAQFWANVPRATSTASLRLQCEFVLNKDGRQEIPLGLRRWIVAGPITSENDVPFSLERSDDRSLILCVDGKAKQRYSFTLPLSAAVETFSDAAQLSFDFPYPTQTDFQLTLAEQNLSIASDGVTDLQSSQIAGETVIQASELSANAVIWWQSVAEGQKRFPTKSQVESTTKIDAVAVGRWQINANIKLLPFAEPVSELLLACPPQTLDFVVLQNNVQATRIDFEQAQQRAATVSEDFRSSQFYILSFSKPLTEASEIQISYLLNSEPDAQSQQADIEFVGHHFFDCLFVAGRVELIRERELSTRWTTEFGLSLAPSNFDSKDAISFNLSRQNFRLSLSTRAQPAQIRIEPEYTLIANDRILLTGNLRCQIQGQVNQTIALPLENWNFISGSTGVRREEARLIFDPSSQALSPNNEVVFNFILETENQYDLQLTIPRLVAASSLISETAKVILVVDDNKEFRFDSDASSVVRVKAGVNEFRSRDNTGVIALRGLIAQKERQIQFAQTVQVFTAPGMLPSAISPNGMSSNTASSNAASPNAASSSPNGLTPLASGQATGPAFWFQQDLSFDVRFQPLDYLWFLMEVPPNFDANSQLQLSLGRTILETKQTPLRFFGKDYLAIEFNPGQRTLLGSFDFRFTGRVFSADSVSNDFQSATLPLVQPMIEPVSRLSSLANASDLQAFVQSQLSGFSINQREILTPWLAAETEFNAVDPTHAGPPLASQITLASSQWATPDLASARTSASARDITSALGPTSALGAQRRWSAIGGWPLTAQVQVRNTPAIPTNLFFHQIHVQTWWQDAKRIDRVVALMQGTANDLQIGFAQGVQVKQVLIDGQPVPFRRMTEGSDIWVDLRYTNRGSPANNKNSVGSAVAADSPAPGASETTSLEPRSQVLELWFSQDTFGSWWWQAALNFPRLPNQEWCHHFSWQLMTGNQWQMVWLSPELLPASDPALAQGNFQSLTASGNINDTSAREISLRLLQAPVNNQPLGLIFSGPQIPSNGSLLLVNRYWLRLTSIAVLFCCVLVVWWTGLFRRPIFWIATSLLLALIVFLLPYLATQLAPLIAVGLALAVVAIWIDHLAQRKPAILSEEDTFIGSTRSLPGSDSAEGIVSPTPERSHSSQQRFTVVVRE